MDFPRPPRRSACDTKRRNSDDCFFDRIKLQPIHFEAITVLLHFGRVLYICVSSSGRDSKLANLVTDMQLNYNACLISLPLTNHAAFMVNI